MNHNQHPDSLQLMAFFDGELNAEDDTRLQEHLKACPECRQELENFGDVTNLIQMDAEQPAPQPVWPFVAAQLAEKKKRQFTPTFAFGTAAACAAGLALGLLMGEPVQNEQLTQTTQVERAWATADFLWSGSDSPTLFTVFSEDKTQERSSES